MASGNQWKVMALTSLSWLLPVELSPDGLEIVALHYDRSVAPSSNLECYGVEDARIGRGDGRWLVTAFAVGHDPPSTVLSSSAPGLEPRFEAINLYRIGRTACGATLSHSAKI